MVSYMLEKYDPSIECGELLRLINNLIKENPKNKIYIEIKKLLIDHPKIKNKYWILIDA